MFKKYSKGFSDQDTSHHPQEDLAYRPHSPFSTDLMNAFSIREQQSLHEETSPEDHEEPETTIAANIRITGSISFEKLLRIDGAFEGELNSSGKLIVGPTGSVKADLNLDTAYISGKVVGDITVKTRLVLRGRAEIRGNVIAPLVSMDEGVSIVGQLNVAPTASSAEEAPIDYD